MQRLIAVDIGNSRIAWALCQGAEVLEIAHCPVEKPERAARAAHLLSAAGGGLPVAVSSVVPGSYAIFERDLAESGTRVLSIAIDNQALIREAYKTMGTDRLANAAAALALYAGEAEHVAVLDFGTATTLTVVRRDGTFAGGMITLGLKNALRSIKATLAQLPGLTLEADPASAGSRPPRLGLENLDPLARDTDRAILSGTVLGHLGMLERWMSEASRRLGGQPTTIATGGLCGLIAPLLPPASRQDYFGSDDSKGELRIHIDHVDPELTLKGISLLAAEAMVPEDRG